MNLYKEFNQKEIQQIQETGVKVEDREYAEDECKRIYQEVINYIMIFSKKEISQKIAMYGNIIDKLNI